MPDVQDVEAVVGQVVPMIGAAVAAYGGDVWSHAEDALAEGTVGAGRRMLIWLVGRVSKPERLREAVGELAAAPSDGDALAALRLQVRKVLTGDPGLVAEVAGMLPARAEASGDQAAAVAGDVHITTSGANSPAALSIGQVRYQGPTGPGRPQP